MRARYEKKRKDQNLSLEHGRVVELKIIKHVKALKGLAGQLKEY